MIIFFISLHHLGPGNFKNYILIASNSENVAGQDADNVKDECSALVRDLLMQPKDSLEYIYDFGDHWQHSVVLEKIVKSDSENPQPGCSAGARACPPEDCGGPGGFENILEILADPEDEEHEEILAWVGGDYDPEAFALEEIQAAIAGTDWGDPGSCWDFY